MGWGHLKIFFSWTTELEKVIFTWKLSDIIQISLNQGPQESGGGHDRKTIITCVYVEKQISRTSRPVSIKHGTNHPWVKGFQNCTNKGPVPVQRGDNHKNAKIWWGHWKIFSLRTTQPEYVILILHESFLT
jgi:hypothetical protein